MTYPVPTDYQYDPSTNGYNDPAIAATRGADIQEVSITDLIAEGPIEGLVNGEASVYISGDQLSDVTRTLVESGKAQTTGNPYSISFGVASANDQPVTASMLDRQGNTAYFNEKSETFTNDSTYRWITVHEVSKFKVKIESIETKRYDSGFDVSVASKVAYLGNVRICAVGGTPLSEQALFTQDMKEAATKRNPSSYNRKPICRIELPGGQTINGSISSTHDANYSSQLNSGNTKRAIVQPWSSTVSAVSLENDIFVNETNVVYGTLIIDRTLEVEIKTVGSNNVIYIPKNSSSLSVNNKTFTLSGEQKTLGDDTSGGTTAGAQKYPGSSVEFRIGTRSQEPFFQIAGRGVSSFPLSLTSSQLEVFDTTNNYPTTIPDGYPTTTPLPSGMVQKNIVFSQSFTGAQINEIDFVKIQFEFPSGHYAMNDGGDDLQGGAALEILLQGSESGGANPTDWEDIGAGAYKYQKWFGIQKTAIAYSVQIPVNTHLNFTDMRLSITRLTPDGASNSNNMTGKLTPEGYIIQNTSSGISAVVDSIKIAQIIATIDEKLEHPFSAMAAIRFSSKSFPNPPKRAYHVRGMKVKVPSNYVPRHLTDTGVAAYTGIWNGEFSDEGTSNSSGLDLGVYYTDNPAWVFYDILVNNRYGLGAFLKATEINKFQLYKIAKYCDGLVPTRNGLTEPRFTANLYLTKATEAYKVLKDMATIFRSIVYWLNGEILTVPDAPATPIYNFSQANIIEDSISSQTASTRSRTNQWTIIWNNPLSAYAQEPLVIEDAQNIIETGKLVRNKAVAFGCTSEGQAIRYGRWKAWTAINQTEIVAFKTSINASFLTPGDVINIQNQDDSGVSFSGRITASSSSMITLDRNLQALAGQPQVDGGAAQSFSFQGGSDYSYTLALLVTKRAVVLNQENPITVTHAGTAYTYYRGDEVIYAKIGGTSTLLINNAATDEQVIKNITNVQDDLGQDIQVDFRNSTTVDTKPFVASGVSVVNGVTRISIASAFTGSTIPDNTVWSIKEVYRGVNTKPSYKEYKILGIKEDKDNNFEISAGEFYNSKFDTIDKDFNLALQDPIDRPESAFIPQPSSVYIMQTPRHKTQLQELQVMWETPRNADSTIYKDLSSFVLHIEPKLPDGTDTIDIKDAASRLQEFVGVPDGVRSFGIQTISKKGRRSEIKWGVIEVKDKFALNCDRTTEGVPLGIRTNSKMSTTTSTWSMKTIDWAMQSPGAPGSKVTNASQSDTTSYQQDLSVLQPNPASNAGVATNTGFIYFDADAIAVSENIPRSALGANVRRPFVTLPASTARFVEVKIDNVAVSSSTYTVDNGGIIFSTLPSGTTVTVSYKPEYFKLTSPASIDFENSSQPYWRDLTWYAANAENDWTDCTDYTNARVTIAPFSNKIVKSEGTTAFKTRFEIGDIVRIKYAAGKYVGGKVAYIQSDDVMFVDRRLSQSATLTSVDELRAIARNTLRPDTANDAVIAQVTRVNSTYTHIPLKWVEDQTLTGLRALIIDSNIVFLNYSGASTPVLQNEAAITLTADAIAYTAPEFIITGGGFTLGSPAISGSAQTSYIGASSSLVTDQTLTYPLHDGSGGVAYGSGNSLDFTVTVRESADGSESKSKNFKIIKIKDGVIGEDGRTVHLTSTDYSIIYDEEGLNPIYNPANGNITITAEANNFYDPLYRFTFAGGAPGAWIDTVGTNAATYLFTAAAIPDEFVKTQWPKVVKVEVGPKAASYSTGDAPSEITAADSISIIAVKTGAGGVALVQPNNAHSYTVDKNGLIGGVAAEVIPNSSTTMELIVGGVVYSYIGGTGGYNNPTGSFDNKEWYIESVSNTGGDLTIGLPTSVSSNVVTIGNHTTVGGSNPTDENEVVTWVIKYKQASTVLSIKTMQSLSRSTTGVDGLPGTSPITASLTNSSHIVSANVSGHAASLGGFNTGAGGTYNVKEGNNVVLAGNCTFSVYQGSGNASAGSPSVKTQNGLRFEMASNGVYRLVQTSTNSWTSTQEIFTIRVVKGTTTIDNVYSISKAVTGIDGTPVASPKLLTGYIYWEGAVGASLALVNTHKTTLQNTNPVFTFGTPFVLANTSFTKAGSYSGLGGANGTTDASNSHRNFNVSPPTQSATRKDIFYVSFSATETVTNGVGDGTGSVAFGTAGLGTSFTGVVVFTDLDGNGATVIHGDAITTGTINADRLTIGNLSGGASRITLSNTKMEVYEGSSGTPRVIIGDLS